MSDDLPEPEYMSAEDARFMLAELASKVNPGLLTAESRIAAALACHTRGKSLSGVTRGFEHCAECGKQWDTEADRCTSPTVTALLGGGA